jgi:uncharacterized membrane protein SirB2
MTDMESKWLSRKLLVMVAVDTLALIAAFGGALSPEQSAAIVTFITSIYMLANAIAALKKK